MTGQILIVVMSAVGIGLGLIFSTNVIYPVLVKVTAWLVTGTLGKFLK